MESLVVFSSESYCIRYYIDYNIYMNISYWHFIAHLLPGFIFITQLFFILMSQKIIETINLSDLNIISFTIVSLFSIPFGLIIDGVHHRFIAPLYKKIINKNNVRKHNKGEMYYLPIIGEQIFNRYYAAFYHASEAYTNIALSLLLMPIIILINSKFIFLLPWLIVEGLFLYSGYEARKRHEISFDDLIDGSLHVKNSKR